jgi:hypothetical protein
VIKLYKILAIITALSLLCISVVGCGPEATTTASTPPSSTATTTKPPTSTPPVSTPPASTPPVATTSKPPTPTPTGGTGLFSISVKPDSLSGDNRFVTWITVTATYGDGKTANVTKQCTYESSERKIAYVVTKDAPGEDADHPPVPGWYVVGAAPGGAIITISYSEGGVTKTCELPVNVIFMMQ